MTDIPPGADNPTILQPSVEKVISFPHIKPHVDGGEIDKKLDDLCQAFENIRRNGFYASDENRQAPRFSDSFVLHGLKGEELKGERYYINFEGGGGMSGNKAVYATPNIDRARQIANLGIISSDIDVGDTRLTDGVESETSGCADFWMQSQHFDSVIDFLSMLRKQVDHSDFITSAENDPYSRAIMFAFDTSRPELAPLIQYAMKDTDPEERLWINHVNPNQPNLDFPMKGSGTHFVVPVGLPANYIEYIVINEKSPYWDENKLMQLRQAAVVDGHPIPLVSIHTNSVLPLTTTQEKAA